MPKTLYARYVAGVTLDPNGGTPTKPFARATNNSTALEYSDRNTGPWVAFAKPTASLPGYVISGYYTAVDAGVRAISDTGSLLLNVTGYTDAAGNLINPATPVRLYARSAKGTNPDGSGGSGTDPERKSLPEDGIVPTTMRMGQEVCLVSPEIARHGLCARECDAAEPAGPALWAEDGMQDTPFPGRLDAGNSVLTGHVVDAEGKPDIFVGLERLQYVDMIHVEAFGERYS